MSENPAKRTNRPGRTFLCVALALPWLAIAGSIAKAHVEAASGVLHTFEIGGFDPRDPLRGHYLLFRLLAGDDPAIVACADDPDCRVCLVRDGGRVIVHAERRVPEGDPAARLVVGDEETALRFEERAPGRFRAVAWVDPAVEARLVGGAADADGEPRVPHVRHVARGAAPETQPRPSDALDLAALAAASGGGVHDAAAPGGQHHGLAGNNPGHARVSLLGTCLMSSGTCRSNQSLTGARAGWARSPSSRRQVRGMCFR